MVLPCQPSSFSQLHERLQSPRQLRFARIGGVCVLWALPPLLQSSRYQSSSFAREASNSRVSFHCFSLTNCAGAWPGMHARSSSLSTEFFFCMKDSIYNPSIFSLDGLLCSSVTPFFLPPPLAKRKLLIDIYLDFSRVFISSSFHPKNLFLSSATGGMRSRSRLSRRPLLSRSI